jgi:hypothetical protein
MEYPNSGSLWPNKNKTTEAHPNLRGSIKMERSLLKELMATSDEELIEIEISAWTKTYKDSKFLSIKGSKPYKKGAPKQAAQDDDDGGIPF